MKYILIAFFAMITFGSCIPPQQAYYLSPQHATTNHYKVMPLVDDSVKSASYASALFTAGGANHRVRDGVLAFQGNFHQARRWRNFQAFYGAGVSAGVYDIQRITFPGNHVDAIWINERSGSQFQGGYGLQAGLNYALPFRKGEWRILGVEGNFQQEYGSYAKFRRELPEDAANIIERSRSYNSFAITSDIIGDFRDGSRIGYKLSYVQSLRRVSGILENDLPVSGYPRYITHTLHISVKKFTGYGQLNFGSEAFNVQVGIVRNLD